MNYPTKKLGEEKRDNVYYLMRDIISCFPTTFENNFLGIINHHFIAKEATRRILIDEIRQEKPRFRTLAGCIILQNVFLRTMQRVALYEVIDIVPALKFCFRETKFKTIKNLSAETILRLFCTLYFEYFIMPLRKNEGRPFIVKFKKYFSREDIVDTINTQKISTKYIFEDHGIDLAYGIERNKRLKEIIKEFYFQKNR